MNEPWVVKMLMGIASKGGIPYAPDSIDKEFSLGIDSRGKLYVKLSMDD